MKTWQQIADTFGFASEHEMWKTLYPTYNIKELAKLVGYSPQCVSNHLNRSGIKTKLHLTGRAESANCYWHKAAIDNGFANECEMWETLYPTVCPSELAKLFKVTGVTILNRVRACKIRMRARGGSTPRKCSQ